MAYETIALAKSNRVAWLTLNRPDALNAITKAMIREVMAAIDEVEADGDTRALVITGAGRAFCAGADLKDIVTAGEAAGPVEFLEMINAMFARQRAFPLPVIAAVNGAAVGGGLELALASDFILAAESAKVGDGHINVGAIPGGGATAMLPGAIPEGWAKYLMYSGDVLGASELQAAGLIVKAFPDGEFEAGVRELAERIAEKSPLALREIKGLLARTRDMPFEDSLKMALEVTLRHAGSDDAHEGARAFAEKRKPEYTGT